MILYGKAYPDEETFDEKLEVKNSKHKLARKGDEWFALDSKFRVVCMADSENGIREALEKHKYEGYGVGGHLRLHSIVNANRGRCSEEECKEIFNATKMKK